MLSMLSKKKTYTGRACTRIVLCMRSKQLGCYTLNMIILRNNTEFLEKDVCVLFLFFFFFLNLYGGIRGNYLLVFFANHTAANTEVLIRDVRGHLHRAHDDDRSLRLVRGHHYILLSDCPE